MRTRNLFALLMAVLVMAACQNSNSNTDSQEGTTDTEMAPEQNMAAEAQPTSLVITLEPKSESNLSGTATFTEVNGAVNLKATINGLSEGEHAIHIHETGDCSSDDGSSAGGHWNPTNQPHGKWGAAEGYHAGDIGNFNVDANGVGTVDFTTDEWCIGCGDPQRDIVGKALIVHEGVDDYTSQPSGDAGARVGCGGLIQ